MSSPVFCIMCRRHATFDSPDDLCDKHWVDWWCSGMRKEGFTKEQIEEYRKEIEEVVASNYKPN